MTSQRATIPPVTVLIDGFELFCHAGLKLLLAVFLHGRLRLHPFKTLCVHLCLLCFIFLQRLLQAWHSHYIISGAFVGLYLYINAALTERCFQMEKESDGFGLCVDRA